MQYIMPVFLGMKGKMNENMIQIKKEMKENMKQMESKIGKK